MAISRQRRPAETFAEQAIALAWGAWSELGVSGWTATHGDWAIDPEPLIIFTAGLGDADPRLRDEATDWCIRNWRLVSKTRLKNLYRTQPDPVREAFGEFSATVATHAGIAWPGATDPRRYTVTGRSSLPSLERPSLAWVRLRAMFGLGARAEVLRYFLSRRARTASVARLADATGYSKRNVAEACETLHRAGVLAVRSVANRFSYRLARRQRLEQFVGELPAVLPEWTALLNITRELVDLEAQLESTPQGAFLVEVRKTFRRIEDDLDELDIEVSIDDLSGEDLWPAVQALGSETLAPWSVGRWPATGDTDPEAGNAEIRRLRPRTG